MNYKDKIKKVKHVKKQSGNYVVSAFHPLAFERGAYTVDIYRKDKPAKNEYVERTMIYAKNEKDAINKFLRSEEYTKYQKRQKMLDAKKRRLK
ncbi:MAG: hypothetical protein QXH07_02040 [Thermoplasmata archaeon]